MTGNGHRYANKAQIPAQCVGMPDRPAMNHCLSDAGFRVLTEFQPADRYWTFQWLESARYVVLAAVLIGCCLVVMHRRDA